MKIRNRNIFIRPQYFWVLMKQASKEVNYLNIYGTIPHEAFIIRIKVIRRRLIN